MSADELRRMRDAEHQAMRIRRGWEAALGGRSALVSPMQPGRTVGGAPQTPIELGSSDSGELLLVTATGDPIASGGDYITAGSILYQHGFAAVTAAGVSIVWPYDAVGAIQVEWVWASYTGAFTIEVEVNGVVPAWGLMHAAAGASGFRRRGVHIPEGAQVKIKVTQASGSPQTGDFTVEFQIQDPATGVVEDPPIDPDALGPYVWYRGEDLAASLSDGDPVSTWVDRTGNGFDLTVPGGLGSPTWRAADLNGLGTVEFDASTTDGLSNSGCTLATDTNEWTVFSVFLSNNLQNDIVNGDNQTSGPGTVRGPRFNYLTGAAVFAAVNEGSSVTDSSGQTVSAGVWYIGEAWRSATQLEALLDGVGNGPTNIAAANPEVGLYIAYHPAVLASSMDGKLAEIIGWNRVLTTDERDLMRAYFTEQYGV